MRVVKKLLKPLTPERVELLVVAVDGRQYHFSRDQFQGSLGFATSRPWWTSPQRVGTRLVSRIIPGTDSDVVTVPSPTLGESVHYVVWFVNPHELHHSPLHKALVPINDVEFRRRRVYQQVVHRACQIPKRATVRGR